MNRLVSSIADKLNNNIDKDICIDIETIFNENANKLLRSAYLILGDKGIAEDVVQDVFTSFYINYKKFRGESKIGTYLYRIMINKCRDKMKQGWFKKRNYNHRIDMIDSGYEEEERVLDRIVLSEKIISLPRKYREVIVLYYYDELSIKEISGVTGIGENAIKQRLKRGRDKLKSMLQGGI